MIVDCFPKIIKFTLIAVATLLLSALWFRWADAASATHADCVAYWTARTATWDNPPAVCQINNDDVYCGNIGA